ncbi:apolipoprotein N-acyltransferase [Chitinophaga pinensis]|uniref:Nitrilase/cyanide hydratase and apolipoprotein N-acyltransferase n=1 Tax=Chitinophaga pinensis (strain ATCC 43595 / DSM 2588 / LMG 13176 / NBRC 15968 / NCIMB 11800 / UQM 2034) TaxID=485918 RepID=A0A979GT82_CHIPD|nr:nitrilase-related carbon-nitrogen hydrolase [Chitinophaga pinensis]ACU59974.1 Nitrilase/cyanide hydratase and apolipoprotein N- acyltransferase [Chitinophaga pinensis DSM 2588]
MSATAFTSRFSVFLSILLSGVCFYVGNGLTGDYWYLVWIAPIPIISLSLVHNRKVAFGAAFLAYAIGRLSWLTYLIRVATLVPALTMLLITALIFAGIIILSRSTAMRSKAWYAVFAFPLYFTAFEYLLFRFSADGTAASIAYSQMNFLPIIQVAAIGGILAITFIITLIPSYIAFAYYYAKNKTALLYLSVVCLPLVIGTLAFGYLRPAHTAAAGTIKIGMATIPEGLHNTSGEPDAAKDSIATALYLYQIDSLAQQGVQVVLLPERVLSIDKHSEKEMMQQIQAAAARNHIYLITGYTNLREDIAYNSALVVDNKGHLLSDYNKRHLVTGFEQQFTPGKTLGMFQLEKVPAAVAICKDLDFQAYIREYGKQAPRVLFVPAWDFIVDDWLHCRMALLRSVENGIPQVRAARTGLLTINDCYGSVSSEFSSAHRQSAALVGVVSLHTVDTFYTRYGDWLGIVSLIAAGLLILLTYTISLFRLQTA